MSPRTPSFKDLRPASGRAQAAARGSSKKKDTKCELLLRRALWRLGLRYRLDVQGMRGRPDIVFPRQRVAVFCDGDFWHGRDLEQRIAKLATGHNSVYWAEKIKTNVARDKRTTDELERLGWRVIRIWESEIRCSSPDAAQRVAALLQRG